MSSEYTGHMDNYVFVLALDGSQYLDDLLNFTVFFLKIYGFWLSLETIIGNHKMQLPVGIDDNILKIRSEVQYDLYLIQVLEYS